MSAPTGIIILIVALIIVKVLLLIYVIHRRRQKKEERAARGCHCFDDVDYYCLPMWYWSSDRGCHCAVSNQPPPNANNTELESGPNYAKQRADLEGGSWNDNAVPVDREGVNDGKMTIIR